MASLFRPTTVADEARLIEFLTRVFSAGRDASFLQPSLLRWKYWDPREDYPEPRSYVIEREGRIVAHAGLWPVTVRTGQRIERGVSMIDWASDPDSPGAGVSLLQRFTKTFDFVYSIGGTEATRAIMPKFGLRVVAEAVTWARPLRPWRQMFHHQYKDLRSPVRLARNFWWSKAPLKQPQREWAAVEENLDETAGLAALAKERDGGFFPFFRRCPAARCLTFTILREGRKEGVFALSVARSQARVAGVWLERPSVDHWRATFQLAQNVALRQTAACEITARSTAPAAAAAAPEAGMRLRNRTPILFYRKGAGDSLPIEFQMLDNDSFFLVDRLAGFLT